MWGHLQFKKLVILHHHRLQDAMSETKFCYVLCATMFYVSVTKFYLASSVCYLVLENMPVHVQKNVLRHFRSKNLNVLKHVQKCSLYNPM
jgi:hypothetical protein